MNVLHHMTHGIQPSREDIKLLSELLHAEEGMLPVEPTGQEEWLSTVIQKPWGYKYRVYVDAFYDLWHLCLRPGESTSLHCHPRKVTALICLHGEGTVRLLSHQQHVKALSCLHLGKGVFHATENSGLTDLDLIEVEVPRNKLDLLRAKDRYGRAGLGYEQPPRQDEVSLMYPGAHRPGSKLRTISVQQRYQFSVLTGQAILTHPQAQRLLCVSLGIAGALQHTIEIFAGHEYAPAREESYFTILPLQEEREPVYA